MESSAARAGHANTNKAASAAATRPIIISCHGLNPQVQTVPDMQET
jgi:hypothetical protein